MKYPVAIASALALFASPAISPAVAIGFTPTTEILIDLHDDTDDADEAAIEAKLGGLDIQLNSIHSADERFFIATVASSELDDLIDRIKDDPRVENVEENFTYEAFMVPDDPLFEKQWSMQMVDAPEAWDHADGKGVIVAVIDTGVAFENHKKFKVVEDLAGTGFVGGYDFVNDDKHPNDDHGHGTHVAGTIAQTTNNGVGVAGLAHKAKIMPLKVLNKRGMGSAADIADAIRFAADEGAHVINMSLGGGMRSLVMQSAVAHARKKGVVVVCAAGNASRGRVEFPAAYKGSFAVSSVGPDRELAFYSSYGKQIAVSAPGGDKQKGGDKGAILQNTITPTSVEVTDSYLFFQGTSMAAPHVAGVAALVISTGVNDATAVENILKKSAVDAGQKGWDERYGHGILNAANAVKAAKDQKGDATFFGFALALLGALVFRLRKTLSLRKLGVIKTVFGALMGSAGLWFLGGLIPGADILSSAMPTWDLFAAGQSWHFSALWASVLPLLGMSIILLQAKRWRGFLIGLSIGYAAHLLLSAFFMPTDVALIPGVAGLLDRAWLLVNGGLLFGLGALIARIESRRHAS